MGQVSVSVEEGITHAVFSGHTEMEQISRSLGEIMEASTSAGSRLVLIDMTDAVDPVYHVNAIRAAERASTLGMAQALSIALVGKAGDPRLRFVEDVAVNRGFRLKSFTDSGEGIAWLRSRR